MNWMRSSSVARAINKMNIAKVWEATVSFYLMRLSAPKLSTRLCPFTTNLHILNLLPLLAVQVIRDAEVVEVDYR